MLPHHFIKQTHCCVVSNHNYKFRFNIEGGKSLDIEMTKERFDSLSMFCEKHLSHNVWKSKTENERY